MSPGPSSFPFDRLLLLVGGQGITALLGFANVALAARYLSASEFGFLATGQALAQGLRLACGTQSWQAVVRHGGRRPLRLAVSLARLDGCLGLLSALVFLGLLHGAGPVFGLSAAAGCSLSWLALGMLVQISDPWLGVLMGGGRHGLVAVAQGATALLRCLGVCLVLGSGGGLGGLVLAHLLADALLPLLLLVAAIASQRAGLRLFCAALHRPLGLDRLRQRFPGLGRLLAVGCGISLLGGLGNQLDVPFAAALLGPEEAGRYRLLRGLAGLALVVATPLRQVCLSHWTAAAGRNLRPHLARAALAALTASALALAGFALCADHLLPLLFGARGLGLGPPASILLLAAGLTVVATLPQALLVARAHEPWNLLGQATAVGVHFTLLPCLALSGGLGLAVWSLPGATAALLAVVGLAAWKIAGGQRG